jgi:hypothetical protein
VTVARSLVDAALAMVAVLAWGFAAFAFGARWLSPLAGGLVGLGVLLSAGTMVLSMHLRDRLLLALAGGACPRCGAAVVAEHRHRHWNAAAAAWAPASTTWDCGACGFSHGESWLCPSCPGRHGE